MFMSISFGGAAPGERIQGGLGRGAIGVFLEDER